MADWAVLPISNLKKKHSALSHGLLFIYFFSFMLKYPKGPVANAKDNLTFALPQENFRNNFF